MDGNELLSNTVKFLAEGYGHAAVQAALDAHKPTTQQIVWTSFDDGNYLRGKCGEHEFRVVNLPDLSAVPWLACFVGHDTKWAKSEADAKAACEQWLREGG